MVSLTAVIDTLPNQFDTPMFWSEDDLAELKGTSVVGLFKHIILLRSPLITSTIRSKTWESGSWGRLHNEITPSCQVTTWSFRLWRSIDALFSRRLSHYGESNPLSKLFHGKMGQKWGWEWQCRWHRDGQCYEGWPEFRGLRHEPWRWWWRQ